MISHCASVFNLSTCTSYLNPLKYFCSKIDRIILQVTAYLKFKPIKGINKKVKALFLVNFPPKHFLCSSIITVKQFFQCPS